MERHPTLFRPKNATTGMGQYLPIKSAQVAGVILGLDYLQNRIAQVSGLIILLILVMNTLSERNLLPPNSPVRPVRHHHPQQSRRTRHRKPNPSPSTALCLLHIFPAIFHSERVRIATNYLPCPRVAALPRNFRIPRLALLISTCHSGQSTHLLLRFTNLANLLLPCRRVDHRRLQVSTTDDHPQACTNLAKMVLGIPSQDAQVMMYTLRERLCRLPDPAPKYLSRSLPLINH